VNRPDAHQEQSTGVILPVCAEDPAADPDNMFRIRSLPKEVGVLMVVAGVTGLILPGPIGAPFLIVGGVVLWPRAFERVEIRFQKRFPKVHRQGMRQIKRFLEDLERRYPSPTP
jgi:hypothetical protein